MYIYIFIVALIVFICLEIFLMMRKKKQLSKRDMALVISEWRSIQDKIEREPKHALLEADKLLDFVLKKRGYTGAVADKLRKAETSFSHLDQVWEAHKLRNRTAHEVGFSLTEVEAQKAVSYIKHALWDLGVKL